MVTALPARAVEVRGVRADLAKLTEFAHLMGEPARDILPSGYLHALAFPVAMSVMVQEDFPLPLLGMIHLRNQVEHFAPVLFTDELSVRAWARDLTGHRSGTQVQIVAEIHNADGTALLWRGRVHLPGQGRVPARAGQAVASCGAGGVCARRRPPPSGSWAWTRAAPTPPCRGTSTRST